jgi:chorismate synthase
MRVALASLARRFLEDLGVSVASRVVSIGEVVDADEPSCPVPEMNDKADASPVRCLSREASQRMVAAIEAAGKAGDTLGGVVEVLASGLPIGLGSYAQWDRRLEAGLAASLMSLNAIKGVENGLGFKAAGLPGSRAHDEYFMDAASKSVGYRSNRSGGIDGGMSTGQTVVLRAAMKPLSTLMTPLRSVNLRSGEETAAHVERSDVCAVPSAGVIAESLVALDLAQAVLEKFGGDSMAEIRPRVADWRRRQDPRQARG